MHALALLKKLIDNATEMEVETINECCCGILVENLTLPKSETLLDPNSQRDILHNTLKIISMLIEDF